MSTKSPETKPSKKSVKPVAPASEPSKAAAPASLQPPAPAPKAEPRKPFNPAEMREKKNPATEAERIAESRKALLAPLPNGMRFFESPEGYIVVAEDKHPHVLCRAANGGKGLMINPKR